MKKYALIISFLILYFYGNAQNPSFQWAKKMSGTVDEWSNSIANDSYGNVFITGIYNGGDLDPGTGTYSVTPNGGFCDLFISKFDPLGNLVWAKVIGGALDDYGYSITVDDSGYVYTNGFVSYASDFDTGPATYTVAGGAFVSKMDNNGNLVWVKSIVGANVSYGEKSVAVDKKGNVYFGGKFKNTVDFDPGTGVYNIAAYGSTFDIFVTRLNSHGDFVWAKRFGGANGTDENPVLTVDSTNNLYITGLYSGSIDCDPGPSVYTLSYTTGSNGMFISKLDSAGNFVWAKSLSSSGGRIETKSIKADNVGNIYLSGDFGYTVDFDPGSGIFTATSLTSCYSIFLLKLDTAGNFKWVNALHSGGTNIGYCIALDKFGHIYMTGTFNNSMDFDAGLPNYTLSTNPSYVPNAFIAKYDTIGNCSWALDIGGSTCYGYAITVDAYNNVYTTGGFYGTVDFGPNSTNLTVIGGEDIFLHKMNDCTIPTNPTNTTSLANKTVCYNNTNTLTAVGSGIINWFASPSGTTAVAMGNSFTPPLMSPGTYTYYVLATTCTTSISRTAIVYTVNPLPNIMISSTNSICIGSSANIIASGANTYTWNTGATTSSITVTPTTTSVYTVTGVDLNNCSNTQTVSVTVDNTCQDVWPGDANSDGTADNLDVLELGLHYTQTGAPRASISNAWQSYVATNWVGTITNGKNLNHSDCNGDGTIDDNDTLAIFNNYGLTHAFKPEQTTTVNPQLSIVPDQTFVTKGNWGTASIYAGDAITSINSINGLAFTVDFDNTLIETNSIYIEYQNSFLDAGQNLHFRKLDFGNGKIFTATTHTFNNNVSGNGLIAKLHYQIKSSLTTDEVLNIGLSQANQSDAAGTITPLTAGTGALMAIGASVGMQELNGNGISVSPNPTNGSLTIKSKTELQKIEVVSITGQVLLSEVPTNVSHTVQLDHFANGIYFVNLYQNNRIVKREKVVLNK